MENFILVDQYDEESNIIINYLNENFVILRIEPYFYSGIIAGSALETPTPGIIYLGKYMLVTGEIEQAAVIKFKTRLFGTATYNSINDSVYFDTVAGSPVNRSNPKVIKNVIFDEIQNVTSYTDIYFLGYKITINV